MLSRVSRKFGEPADATFHSYCDHPEVNCLTSIDLSISSNVRHILATSHPRKLTRDVARIGKRMWNENPAPHGYVRFFCYHYHIYKASISSISAIKHAPLRSELAKIRNTFGHTFLQ